MRKQAQQRGTWEGGRTYQNRYGHTVWVIRRRVDGQQREFFLHGVETAREARKELRRFEDDPRGYRAPQDRKADEEARLEQEREDDLENAVFLDADTVGRFLASLRDRTEKYRVDTRRYLAHWADKLAGQDLRTVTPKDVARLLSSWNTAEQKRIAAIKALCSFLVKKGLLDPAEDPSRSLTAPPARPEKALREKGYPMDLIEGIYRHVREQGARDVLLLHAKLGLHNSEVERMAKGEGQLTAVDHPEIAGTIRFIHKSGKVHTVSVDAQAFAAAKRLQEAGAAPSADKVRWAIGEAVQAAGLEKELAGRGRRKAKTNAGKRPPTIALSELRHSFVAWSLEHGERR